MTLSELAVTIGIVATITSIAVPSYNRMKDDADCDAQIKETKLLINAAQYECIAQGRHALISITPTGVSVTTIPEEYDEGTTPTYTLLSAATPTLPIPPGPSITTKDRHARFPWNKYQAAYIDRRGSIYTLDEDSKRVDDPFALCTRGRALVFSPMKLNYGRYDESKDCIPTEVTLQ